MKLEDYPCTVLLADDEEDIRDVLRISLSDMGYKVYSAQNGEEALQIFQTVMPMIVITDIKMPGMDGIELLKKIKRENPDTEVIMITGHGDMELAIKSLKYKAVDFITKPINVDALEISVSRAREKVIMKQKLQEYTENLERLIQEKTELQDHLSSLGLMIGSISHGIKGLLTGLDGGMYLLNTGFSTENSDRIREGWDIVRFMVERIRKMILDILFYAKKRELNWEQINAVGFADDVARVVEPKIKNHGIEFVRDFEESVGGLEIDAGYIHAAMVNILDNAVDACLKDKSKDSHKIVFSVRQAENFILFDISDNGIGMKQETVEKLFRLFFSTKGSKGTGFGLFISNQIIQQHGGSISVKSSPNKGTTFTIRIPKILPESAKADSQTI
ncbi:MAG TPA: response regulator [Desulfobacteraceae bacterium]|nr:response regulator [Desulfobacteraceae bacterium]